MSLSTDATAVAYGNPAFFEKNKLDLDYGSKVVITATDTVATDPGQTVVDYMRDRRNDTGWATQGSSDAGGTKLIVDLGDTYLIDTIAMTGINWKSFTVKYWNGSSYTTFSSAIAPTTNTLAEPHYQFTAVELRYLEIVINSTMTADDEKLCAQLIVTRMIGQFVGMKPEIKEVVVGRNRKTVKMVDGRMDVRRGVGAFSLAMAQDGLKTQADVTLVRDLFDYRRGFLVWLCGGVTSQFPVEVDGYRRKDWVLMNLTNDLPPNFLGGFYPQGLVMDLQLVEVV